MRGLARAIGIGLLALACGGPRGREEAPAPIDTPALRDSFVADTQYVVDSLGNQLMIVSERTRALLPREIHPRGGSGGADAPDAFRLLDPATAHSLMQAARPPWYVIDVRDSRAWATRGHLEKAALVPLAELRDNIDDLHVRTDQIVLVYADDTERAREAAAILADYGFPHLRVLEGGLPAWREAGLPVAGR